MKEVPILFSTDMMRANLAGIKTETRRTRGLNDINQAPDEWQFCELELNPEILDITTKEVKKLKGLYATFKRTTAKHEEYRHIRCPYGQPGDILWFRETWAPAMGDFAYKADYSDQKLSEPESKGFWHPSIHMPKSAARLWALNIHVNIQRLQQITPNEAILEGLRQVKATNSSAQCGFVVDNNYYDDAVDAYAILWEKINGNGAWRKNPFVWVIKYKTISTTGKPFNHPTPTHQ